MTRKKISYILLVSLLIIFAWCYSTVAVPIQVRIRKGFQPMLRPDIINDSIDPNLLHLAYKAYMNAKAAGYGNKDILTIVDYSLPSTSRRLWVIDMQNNRVIFNTHVAHGLASGDNYATRFSNRHGSHMSSLGMFLTSNVYVGNYGYSLNLIGLEENFNSNALARRIVFHKAHYVDENIIKKIGRIGRSHGCLALNKKIADKVINTIKDGCLVFCYYPDQKWLTQSKLLNG